MNLKKKKMTKTKRELLNKKAARLGEEAVKKGIISMGTFLVVVTAVERASYEDLNKIKLELEGMLEKNIQVRPEVELDPDDPFGVNEMIEEPIESDEYLDTWMKDCGYDGKLVV
jgi:hypothetical protein